MSMIYLPSFLHLTKVNKFSAVFFLHVNTALGKCSNTRICVYIVWFAEKEHFDQSTVQLSPESRGERSHFCMCGLPPQMVDIFYMSMRGHHLVINTWMIWSFTFTSKIYMALRWNTHLFGTNAHKNIIYIEAAV